MNKIYLMLGICALALSCNAACAEVRSGERPLLAFLDYRRGISQGELVFRTQSKEVGHGDRIREWKIYFDGDKLRGDMRYDGREFVKCVGCLDVNDSQVSFDDGRSGGMPSALVVRDVASLSVVSSSIPAPRWIGAFTIDSMNMVYYQEDIFFTPAETTSPIVTVVDFGGVSCEKVAWTNLKGMHRTAWISPKQGHSILKCETTYDAGGAHFVESIVSEVRWYKKAGVWFPAKVEYRQVVNDQLRRQETLTVVSFSDDVSSDAFTLAGIDILPRNTHVSWTMDRDRPAPADETLVFDGANITSTSGVIRPPASPYRRIFISINLAIISIIIAAVFLKRHWRRNTSCS